MVVCVGHWVCGCRYYQKTTEVLLRRLPFGRLVREVQSQMNDPRFTSFRWKSEALSALQEVSRCSNHTVTLVCKLLSLYVNFLGTLFDRLRGDTSCLCFFWCCFFAGCGRLPRELAGRCESHGTPHSPHHGDGAGPGAGSPRPAYDVHVKPSLGGRREYAV